jgi:hypothetical protein
MRRLEEIEADLAGIDAALHRLDAGTYGSCEVCGTALSEGHQGNQGLDRHPDAGASDAATSDAATPDAGTPGAGTPNGGIPDVKPARDMFLLATRCPAHVA